MPALHNLLVKILPPTYEVLAQMEPYTEDKITIIEGPPPVFELMRTEWTQSLAEGPVLSEVAMTRLRTFNGPSLVERCHRAWRNRRSIHLEYRSEEGLLQKAPIVAARTVNTEEGDVLMLWIRINMEESEVTFERETWNEDAFDEAFDADYDEDDLMEDGYDLAEDDEFFDLDDNDLFFSSDDDEESSEDDDDLNLLV
ncbi:MAG: hypothetical protein D6755_02885 [Anaerolineae bacterium]|nr:MAG: hypothetical protein D6755_02885 [Anaerolineae bacterium]